MSRACRRPGAFRRRRISRRPKTRCRSRASRTPAASSSARPTCRSGSATGRAITRSTAPPTTRSISAARRAAPPAASSAALAAGYGPLSLGSDIGGSLRVPAFHCGVYAHKPTFDLVAMRGHTPPPLPPLPSNRDLSVIGPMARCAADLSLLLDVIAGPDPLDAGKAYSLALPPPRHTELKNFRVLLIDTDPVMPTDKVVRGTLEQLAANLAKAGVKVDAQQSAVARLRRVEPALYADADVVPRGVLCAGGLCRRAGRRGGAAGRRQQPRRRAPARHRAQPSRLADGRRRPFAPARAMARTVQDVTTP